MRHFYGVYLESTAISTILDVVRFCSEPDSIRFAHITLRGPYHTGLNKAHLQQLNAGYKDRTIAMLKADKFLSGTQSTAVILVDLRALSGLLYKPDFPDGTPHITLYDGKDRDFCADLSSLAQEYNWENELQVGLLQEITPKKKIDQEFLPFFTNFYKYFRHLVGDPSIIPQVRYMCSRDRLDMIKSVFEKCTVTAMETDQSQQSAEPHRLSLAI